ncbi:hypothetical protein PI124_g4893 [Phytophthora idaei]|nr:hypothetical protein PI125_g13417 [Phytophthora idaei]KAG3165385.1 hypothetical protein PI126_g4680 [Phytophthora idaei]KAG3250480.1 hypothetical protein PI124_g4893 [Phytophthora idaei]
MYQELIISSAAPAHKLRKAVKTGKLSLTAAELSGTGAKLHIHPESHEKALKAKKAGRGVRLHITKHEIKKGYKRAQGGSIWSKVWGGIKSAFKFAKDSGLLSKAADVAVPALASAVGQPELAIPARASIKALTGVGVDEYESDSDVEGGRISFADVKRHAGNALRYAKTKRIITNVIDEGEKFLHTKATKPEHHELISSVRKGIKHRFGVGIPTKRKGKFAKGSPEAKAHMATLRAKRKGKTGGSFRLN